MYIGNPLWPRGMIDKPGCASSKSAYLLRTVDLTSVFS